MKKLICGLLIVIMAFCLVACDSGWKSTVKTYGGEVSSNGGFAVEKGDYVYFINGVAETTADNSFGTPIKGALVRMKKADLGKENTEAEVVIPKLIYSGSQTNTNGVYIFGEYVYYASPCAERNKKGEVRNTELEFFRTKLDGTDTKSIVIVAANTANYRYYKSGENVFVTVYVPTKDDTTKYCLETYNCVSGEKVNTSKAITSYVFPTDDTAAYAYYTNVIHNEILDADETFNRVMRYKLDGSEDKEVLNGAGKLADAEKGTGVTGVKFAPIATNGKQLFLSGTFTAADSTSLTFYYGIDENKLAASTADETASNSAFSINTTVAENNAKLVCINEGTSNASELFASSTIYISLNAIVYFDSTLGIVKYNYENAANSKQGKEIVYYDADVMGYTFSFIKGGYVYATDSSDAWHRYNLSAVLNFENGAIDTAKADEVKDTQINYYTLNGSTSWWKPEIVGDYFLATVKDEPYSSYVCAISIAEVEKMTDEQLEEHKTEMTTVDKAHIMSRIKKLIGIMSDADKETYDAYMIKAYGEDYAATSTSTSTSESAKA